MKSREELKVEVTADLGKSEEELLVDVYDEIINHDNNVKHAAKRYAALIGKSAIESAKLQKEMRDMTEKIERMTCWLKWLTVALLILTVLSTFRPLPTPTNSDDLVTTQNQSDTANANKDSGGDLQPQLNINVEQNAGYNAR